MLTQNDLNEIKKIVKVETKHLPSKEDFYSKVDDIMKELRDIREEQSIITGRNSEFRETLRVLVTKLAKKEISFKVEETGEYIKLSPAAKKRYAQMKKDFETGKNIYSAKNIDDFFDQLNA